MIEVAVGSAVALTLLLLVSSAFRYAMLEDHRLHTPLEAIVVEDEEVDVALDSPNNYHVRELPGARIRLTNKRILIGTAVPFPPGKHLLEAVIYYRKNPKIEADELEAHDRSGFGIFKADVARFTYDESPDAPAIRIPVASERGAHQLVNEIVIRTPRWKEYKRMFDLKSK